MKKKRSLSKKIILMTVLPLLLVGLMLTVYSGYMAAVKQQNDLKSDLKRAAEALRSIYKEDIENWDAYTADTFPKKEAQAYIELLSGATNADITLFFGDVRVATKLKTADGYSAVGTTASEDVVEAVLVKGQDYSVTNSEIEGLDYSGYYIPLRNADGEIVGMAFAGRRVQGFNAQVWSSVAATFIIIVVWVVVFGIVSYRFSSRLVTSLRSMMNFMARVAKGELVHSLDVNVLQRGDEISELGEYAMSMSAALEKLTWSDPLTGLSNRRAGTKKLSKMIAAANGSAATIFSVAMADIDFFKHVNDTYGHAAGDEVLKKVSSIIDKHIAPIGFASRWGGEEFLIVGNVERKAMEEVLKNICDEIRAFVFEYDYQKFSVTITMGLTQYRSPDRMEVCVANADRLLYYAKEAGRDRIVSE